MKKRWKYKIVYRLLFTPKYLNDYKRKKRFSQYTVYYKAYNKEEALEKLYIFRGVKNNRDLGLDMWKEKIISCEKIE